MRWVAFFLLFLTLATGCVLEDKPVIPEDGGVEAGMCGVCPLDTPICNDDFECVECDTSSDCSDPDAARCNPERSECEACQGEPDCTGIDGLPRCEAGTCVECTSGTEEADCNGNSCDPATFMCTGTTVGSLETCEECVADSECGKDGSASEEHRCVEMFCPVDVEMFCLVGERFPDEETGFCLKVFAPGGCERPYAIRISDRESLSGDPLESYCGINETLATCPAVRDLDRLESCPGGEDIECSTSGRCRDVGGLPDRCTYRCEDEMSNVECVADSPPGRPGSNCGSSGSGGDRYCGG
jgi:hypothetical protein